MNYLQPSQVDSVSHQNLKDIEILVRAGYAKAIPGKDGEQRWQSFLTYLAKRYRMLGDSAALLEIRKRPVVSKETGSVIAPVYMDGDTTEKGFWLNDVFDKPFFIFRNVFKCLLLLGESYPSRLIPARGADEPPAGIAATCHPQETDEALSHMAAPAVKRLRIGRKLKKFYSNSVKRTGLR